MTNHAPPTGPVKTPGILTLTAEASGFVLTCACKWVRYFVTRPEADAGGREHEKRCKGEPEKTPVAAAKAARSIGWDDREGATWIDSL